MHKSSFINSLAVTILLLEEIKTRLSGEKFIKFVNKQTNQGFRAIHFASYRGNIDIINYLLKNGANLEIKTKKGLNVLHIAAQGDQPQSLVYFLEKFKFDLDLVDKLGSSVLHWTCYSGSENVFNFIIHRYLDLVDINKKDNQGLTPLHLAIISGKNDKLIIL